MRLKRVIAIGIIALIGLVAFGSARAATVPITLRPAAPIRLQAGTFAPGLGESLAVPQGLEARPLPAGEAGYYIVQFHGPVRDTWRAKLENLGIAVGDYIPDYALKVRMTPEQAQAAAQIREVNWVGRFAPAYKISPSLVRSDIQLYRVSVDHCLHQSRRRQ
jgi:hypothetical protein